MGVPANVAVPSWSSVKVRSPGSVDGVQPVKPMSLSVGLENPAVVTVKVPPLPAANVAVSALVMPRALVVAENWAVGALTQSALTS